MDIRRFSAQDACAVSDMVVRTLRTVNIRDYTVEYIEKLAAKMTPEHMSQQAARMHFYVACEHGRIVGSGAVGPYEGRADESCFFTIFVAPECQGRGVGRAIVDALEHDEYCLRARRVEVPASITAVDFYRRLGYGYRDGAHRIDEDGLCRLEKFKGARNDTCQACACRHKN